MAGPCWSVKPTRGRWGGGGGLHPAQHLFPAPSPPRSCWVLSLAGVGRACAALWLLAWFDFSSFLVTESDLPLDLICLFLPLVIWLFHFNLIRTPCQEKAMQGVLTSSALGISHSVPIVVNGNLAPKPFILVSSINTVKNLWILKRQYLA